MKFFAYLLVCWLLMLASLSAWAQTPMLSFTQTNVSCFGDNDGAINLTVTGGTPPYQYQWTGPSGYSNNIEDLNYIPNGLFKVIVTDAAAQSDSVEVTITEPPILSIALSSLQNPTTCNPANGSITANVTGGTPPYTYDWSNGATTSSISGLSGGTYSLIVTDANGCSKQTNPSLVGLTPPPVAASSNFISVCAGGSVTLTATGGQSYSWQPGNLTGASVPAVINATTTFTVTGTAANNCSATATVVVVVVAPQAVVVSSNQPAICSGGGVTLTASGADTYAWAPATGLSSTTAGVVFAEPPSTVIYTVTGYSASSCVSTATYTLNVSTSPIVVDAGANQNICPNSSFQLNGSASGGNPAYAYSWSPSAGLSSATVANPTASPAANTTYTLTVVDLIGCQSMDSVTLTIIPPIINAPDSINFGAAFTPTTSTGFYTAYQWDFDNDGSNDATGTAPSFNYPVPGTYTFKLIGQSANCSGIATKTVVVLDPTALLNVNASGTTTFVCGGTANLSAIANQIGVTYSWQPTAGLANPNAATTTANPIVTTVYTVTTTKGAETATDTVKITVNPITAYAEIWICQGQPQTLNPGAGSAFSWSPNGQTTNSISVNTAGTYSVIYNDTNGCANVKTYGVSELNQQSFSLNIPDTVYIGLPTNVSVSGAIGGQLLKYDWVMGIGSQVTLTPQPQIISVKYTITGNNSVKVYLSTPGCADTVVLTKNIIVRSSQMAIQGRVYQDANQNNVYDAGEQLLSKVVRYGTNQYCSSSYLGQYSFVVQPNGSSSITVYIPSLPNNGQNFVPANWSKTIPYVPGGLAVIDFAYQINPNFEDLSVEVYSACPFVGLSRLKAITVKNNGASVVSPTLTLSYDSLNVYLPGASPAPDSVDLVARKLTWNLSPLAPGQSANVDAYFKIQVGTPLGTPTSLSAQVSPFADDAPLNNTFRLNQNVCNSFDPNDKTAYLTDLSEAEFARQGDTIIYRVRFHNTGNAPAHNIEVIDTLPNTELDLSTLEFIAASHAVDWRLHDDGILNFYFPWIMLPDSASDPEGSQGEVWFRARLRDSLACETQLQNRCGIYFDFNPPVMTNYAQTLVNPTPTAEIISDDTLYASDVPPAGFFKAENAAENLNYLWNFGANAEPATATGAGPHFVAFPYDAKSPYTVELTVSEGKCENVLTKTFEIKTSSGVNKNEILKLRAYPNPAADRLTVELGEPAAAETRLTLVSLEGQTVLSAKIAVGQTRAEMNLNGLARGVYTLRGQSETGVVWRKIVVE